MLTNRFVYATTEEAATSTGYTTMPARRSAVGQVATARYDILALVVDVYTALTQWYRFRRTFNKLNQLDDRILRDIGLRRDEIEPTASKLAQRHDTATPCVW